MKVPDEFDLELEYWGFYALHIDEFLVTVPPNDSEVRYVLHEIRLW